MSDPIDLSKLLEELDAAVRIAKWKLIVANEAAVVYVSEVGTDGWSLTVMRAVDVDVDTFLDGRLDGFNYVGAGASSFGAIVRMPVELAEVAFKLAERLRTS
jgi:hypothetical protein